MRCRRNKDLTPVWTRDFKRASVRLCRMCQWRLGLLWGETHLFEPIMDHVGAVEEKRPGIVSCTDGSEEVVAEETVNGWLGLVLIDFKEATKTQRTYLARRCNTVHR